MRIDQKQTDIEYQAPDQIATFQLQQLNRHLAYLQKASPYYQALLRDCSFDGAPLENLAALETIPLTGKEELSLYNRQFLAVEEEWVVDICQTSGTTGEPATLWQSENDLQRLAFNEERAFRAAGVTATDRVLVGAALDRVFMAGLAYYMGVRQIGATAIRAGSGQPALIADLICRQQPNVIVGVPSLLLGVARQLDENGINPATLGVDKLICIGEPVRAEELTLSALGSRLQEVWQADIYGTYASTELATSFCDCHVGCGGHLPPELVVLEIIDDEGNPVATGDYGEIVVTPLGTEATPLLRYRTGDIARLHTEACHCGRKTPRLGPIVGRRAQMLKCSGTTLFPSTISAALQEIHGVQGHLLEVSEDYDLSDRLKVVVGCADASLTAEVVASQIAARARVRPEVVLVSPDEILDRTVLPGQRKPVTFFDKRKRKIGD